MPTTTTSAGITLPSASRTRSTRRSPSIAATALPVRIATPWSRWIAAKSEPIDGPSACSSGCPSASISITSRPRSRQLAATSAPMKPPPTTATRGPASSAARIASASSSVRSMKTPSRSGWPGSLRGAAPVAMTRPSNAICAPPSSSTRRSRASSRTAREPKWSSACSGSRPPRASAMRSASHSPRSTCFESGGRS